MILVLMQQAFRALVLLLTLTSIVDVCTAQDHASIPPGTASGETKIVYFNGALNWFQAEAPQIEDFGAVTEVVVFGGLSLEFSKFIASFPKLESLSVIELARDTELNLVMSPFEKSGLKHLNINMVEYRYQPCTFLKKLSGLESLTCDVPFSEDEMMAIGELRNLQELDLVVEADCEAQVLNLPKLISLSIMHTDDLDWFEDSKIESLMVFENCTQDDLARICKIETLTSIDIRLRRSSLQHCTEFKNSNRISQLKIRLSPELEQEKE